LSAGNMNDLSGTVNLLTGTQQAAGKNPVLNSSFNVWQRGTSIAGGNENTYTADRWVGTRAGAAAGMTVSRQTTGDTTNLPFIQYCARVQRNNANASTASLFLAQSFENINSTPFIGKSIVYSFYARAGANYSSASGALTVIAQTGTGTDQNILSTWTGASSAIGGTRTATLTTTWQRFTFTGTASSTGTQFGLYFNYTPVGTAGASDYFEITGVQLEASTTAASAYSPNGATYQAELAACQRYYYRVSGGAAYSPLTPSGFSVSTTGFYAVVPFPNTMRVAPTAVEQTGTAANYSVNEAGSGFTCNAVPSFINATVNMATTAFTFASGLTTGRGGFGRNDNNTAAYLGWSAEL